MTIRIPESRLVSQGPGHLIDPLTGSGITVQKRACSYPNVNVNASQVPVMTQQTWEAWINRCTNQNRLVQVARVSVKIFVLTTAFPLGTEIIEGDSVIDFDNTIIAKPGDGKGLLTKSFDLVTGLGFNPEGPC